MGPHPKGKSSANGIATPIHTESGPRGDFRLKQITNRSHLEAASCLQVVWSFTSDQRFQVHMTVGPYTSS